MHLAIIMDGNRRWAGMHALETVFGHHSGASALDKVASCCPKYGVDTLSVYAFSTENYVNRSPIEIAGIFSVLVESARKYKRKLIGENVRVRLLGEISKLPLQAQEALGELVEGTKNCSDLVLQICLNYGGREEIVQAARQVVENKEEISEATISKYIGYAAPDVIMRTSGEKRISNFMLWGAAYSELYFTDTLWPDMGEEDIKKMMEWYNSRQRRFGK